MVSFFKKKEKTTFTVKKSMKMYFQTPCRFMAAYATVICCFVILLYVSARSAYAYTPPDYPKPSITSNQRDVSYVILPNRFNGAEYDRSGYGGVLITDEYSTLCGVGDEIRVAFNEADRPDKIVMRYNPNTMFNPEQIPLTYYHSEALEIEHGFVIKNEHLNPKNKDTMYYLTATWKNGDSLEYAFLVLTDENIVPVRETKVDPVYVEQPQKPIIMSNITVEVAEMEQLRPQIKISSAKIIPDIYVISGLSEFDNIELDGVLLNSKPYGIEQELFVPLRAVSKALGYEVLWQEAACSVEVRKANEENLFESLKFTIGSNKVVIRIDSSEKEVITIAKPVLKDGVSYISLKDCMKFFGIDLVQRNRASIDEEDGELAEGRILYLYSLGEDAVVLK